MWQKGPPVCARRIRVHSDIPETGNLRAVIPDATSGRFQSREYRGRVVKNSKPDKARYMNVAEGSLEECRFYLVLASDLGYGQTDELQTMLEEVSRLLNSYAHYTLAPGSRLLAPPCSPFWMRLCRARFIRG